MYLKNYLLLFYFVFGLVFFYNCSPSENSGDQTVIEDSNTNEANALQGEENTLTDTISLAVEPFEKNAAASN